MSYGRPGWQKLDSRLLSGDFSQVMGDGEQTGLDLDLVESAKKEAPEASVVFQVPEDRLYIYRALLSVSNTLLTFQIPPALFAQTLLVVVDLNDPLSF